MNKGWKICRDITKERRRNGGGGGDGLFPDIAVGTDCELEVQEEADGCCCCCVTQSLTEGDESDTRKETRGAGLQVKVGAFFFFAPSKQCFPPTSLFQQILS